MNSNNNGFRKWIIGISMLLLMALFAIGGAIIREDYNAGIKRDAKLDLKLDKTLYDRDRAEILDRLKEIEKKIDVLIQRKD